MIGKIFAGRYQVIEKIGEGGTAFVYRGMDSFLNRHVTIKVLRSEHVSDKDFVRRFRQEAQAAASLAHPNIVSIYDVGFEKDNHYIVMEYIKGRSLKEMIEAEGPLDTKTALEFAYQIAQALSHAHARGFVHRDIKPHNVLIGEDGRVRVADFGIAQAVTTGTLTYDGSIVGSVHYFSPEQAKGMQTNEKSDIYSLGIVLYEMLTGEVPFDGEAPYSVALKHIQDPFPDARDKKDDIPGNIAAIIDKSVEKDPEKRYRAASEMIADISAVQKGSGDELLAAKGKKVNKLKFLIDRRWKKATLASLAFILFAAVAVTLWFRGFLYVPEVTVPDVEGKTLAEAEEILEEAGLDYRVGSQIEDDEIASGLIISQSPSAGRKVKKGREITLITSLGPRWFEMADVIGESERAATILLQGMGLEVEVRESHSDKPPGIVFRQDPGEGVQVRKGTRVVLWVSTGGRPVSMRDLVGISIEDARNWARLHDLEVRAVERYSEEYAAGIVISQNPEAGEMVSEGSFIDLVVSKGPEQVEGEEDAPDNSGNE